MNELIEMDYFNWLCAKVLKGYRNARGSMYYDLLHIMHNTEFVWLIIGDKNRAEDGLELRQMFRNELNIETNSLWDTMGCSVFEMILAFSTRCEFQTDISTRDWFWRIVGHLNLDEYRNVQEGDIYIIQEILYKLVWRLYDHAGHGGMFPLNWPKRDQRQVEIWYQFCDFVDENQLI